MKRLIIAFLIIGSIGAGVGWYYTHRGTGELQVNTLQVTRGPIIDAVGSTGTIQAVTSVTVGSQVSGNISELDADFNSIVKKGQVIAKIDPTLLQAQVDQSKANLDKSRADLTRQQVALEDSQIKLKRAEDLNAKQLVTQADLDTARIAVKTAQASLISAQQTVTQAEATLHSNEVNVEHCTIYAPIDGIVTQRSVDVGQTVAASMSAPTIFVIAADLTRLQINASIDESDVGRIRPAQNVVFRVDAYPGQEFAGIVAQVRLQPTVVQNVTTYSTIISVPNPDFKLKLGMTANLKIQIDERQDVTRIPNAALRFRPTNDMFAALNQPVPPEAGGGRGGGGARGGAGRNAQGGGPQSPQGSSAAPAARGPEGAPAAAPTTNGATPRGDTGSASAEATNAAGARNGNGNGAGRGNGGGGRGNFGGGGANANAGGGGGGGGRRNRSDPQSADNSGAGGGGRGNGGGGRGGGRGGGAMPMDQFKAMTADQQKQMVDRMKSRGQDTKQYEDAMKPTAKVAMPAPKYGAAMSAETIDQLFPPLPPVESRGRAWLYQGNQLKVVNLRLGITDGNQTELLDGTLEPGAELVSGIVLPNQNRNALGQGNPFGPQGGRGPGGPGGGFGGPGGGRGGGR